MYTGVHRFLTLEFLVNPPSSGTLAFSLRLAPFLPDSDSSASASASVMLADAGAPAVLADAPVAVVLADAGAPAVLAFTPLVSQFHI
jgi:hypothetical protein